MLITLALIAGYLAAGAISWVVCINHTKQAMAKWVHKRHEARTHDGMNSNARQRCKLNDQEEAESSMRESFSRNYAIIFIITWPIYLASVAAQAGSAALASRYNAWLHTKIARWDN